MNRSLALPNLLISLAAGLLIFILLQGTSNLWMSDGITLFPSGTRALLYYILPLCLISLYLGRGSLNRLTLNPRGPALALLLLFISDWLCRPYNLLQGPTIRGEILLFGALGALLLRLSARHLFAIGAIGGALILLASFHDVANGRLLFSDDHSVVLYRLQLLKKHFPFIPLYNPLWNTGLDARDFFATGILNLFFLSAPLLYLFDIAETYNIIVSSIFFLLVPLCGWGAGKLFGLRSPGPSICAMLSLTTGLFWYRWCLKYGSMGFVTSTSLVLLNLVLAHKILTRGEDDTNWKLDLLFIASFTLMLFWSLTAFIFIPAAIIALFQCRALLSRRSVRRILVALLCINLPWMLMLASVSKIDRFLNLKPKTNITQATLSGAEAPTRAEFSHQVVKGTAKSFTIKRATKSLREWAKSTNPLLLLLGIPGLFVMRRRGSTRFFLATASWLLLLGVVAAPLKPQLELDRMLLILGFVLCLPTASLLTELIHSATVDRCRTSLLCSIIPIGFLFSGLFSVGAIVYNRSPELYFFSDGVPEALAYSITQHGGEGRTVFSGFVLHELSNGHVAPLNHLTPKPLVASTPFHNVWWYTELIPRDYLLRKDEGIEEYLDLVNATAVVAHHKTWRDYFLRRTDRYTFVERSGVFNLFTRKSPHTGWFLEGEGKLLEQDTGHATFEFTSPDGILKFTWYPFLVAKDCTLAPVDLPGGMTFIRYSRCPVNAPVKIRARWGLGRLLQ